MTNDRKIMLLPVATLLLALPALGTGVARGEVYVPTYRLFISSILTMIDGNAIFPPSYPYWGGLRGGDWTVTSLAYDAGLIGADWDGLSLEVQAILSTYALNARTRLIIAPNLPLYNMNGQLVAANVHALWNDMLQAPIMYDEYGRNILDYNQHYLIPLAWTGTAVNGRWSQNSCGAWNSTVGNATAGIAMSVTSGWIQGDIRTAADRARLYGVLPEAGRKLGSPIADNGGPYRIRVGDDLTLNASGSYDLDHGNFVDRLPDPTDRDSLVDYRWSRDGLIYDAGATPTIDLSWADLGSKFGITQPGSYQLSLTVTDADALTCTIGTSLRVDPVPEPSTLALLGTAAIGLLACAWRRHKRAA